MSRKARQEVKLGPEHPFAVRKTSWDVWWHVEYYARNHDGQVYPTYSRVSRKEALRAVKKLVNQYGSETKGLRQPAH